MRSLLIILLTGAFAYRFTDLESPSFVSAMLMPLLLTGCLIATLLWLVLFLNNRGVDLRGGGGRGTSLFDSDGGDGGGD